MDEYCAMLEKRDSATRYIKGILSSFDTDMAMGAMDFALTHLPTFVDTSWYKDIRTSLQPEEIDRQMSENFRILEEDETGEATQLVAMDPLNLRETLMGAVLGGNAFGGFTMQDGHLF